MTNGATLTVTPSIVSPGDDITITYSNPLKANQTITVELDNGGDETASVEITLDSNGAGSGTWSVPTSGWNVINANAPNAPEANVVVEGG